MSRKKRKKKPSQSRPHSTLDKHRREGKSLKSPFGGMANLRSIPWLRDQFPDYLWVCWHLSDEIDQGRELLISVFDLIEEVLDRVLENTAADRDVFDGSLASWEVIPAEAQSEILEALAQRDLYESVVPSEFAQALGMYPDAPGSWMLSPWLERNDFRIDPEVAEPELGRVIVASVSGRDPAPTQAKMMALRGLLFAQKVRFPQDLEVVDLLPRWPDQLSDDERQRVESFARASFNVSSGLVIDAEASTRLRWAQRFWRANWRLYPCRISNDVEHVDEQAISEKLAEIVVRIDALWGEFEQAAIVADPDLYDSDRYEVLAGFAARSLRVVTNVAHSPGDWTPEHAAPRVRALIETLITVSWLVHREDQQMYRRFKEFGRGRLKLLKLHLEEYADSLDEVPGTVQSRIDELQRLVNQDIDEEFQNIDLGGTFSGLDVRKMAYEVGLESEYRLGFAPSSSDTHGEWSHLDRYVLTRCLNPTHRWHRIPRQSTIPSMNLDVVDTMVDLARRVVERFIEAIPTTLGTETVETDKD